MISTHCHQVRRHFLRRLLLAASLTAPAIVSLAAEPAPAAAQEDPMRFVRGAQTWASNCGRCHNMRDPKELRDDQWRAVVAHMRIRAHLTGGEARDVLEFLQQSN